MAVRLNNICPFFSPDAPAEGTPPPPKEVPDEGGAKPVYTTVFNGERVAFTQEDLDRVTHEGLAALVEKKKKADAPPPPPKPVDPAAPPPSETAILAQQVKELKEEMKAKDAAATLKQIRTSIKTSEVNEVFHPKVESTILNRMLIDMHNGVKSDVDAIIADELRDWSDRQGKVIKKGVDVQKKLTDAERLKLAGSGSKSPEQETKPPLNRTSFRDGSLAKRAWERAKGMLGE